MKQTHTRHKADVSVFKSDDKLSGLIVYGDDGFFYHVTITNNAVRIVGDDIQDTTLAIKRELV